MAGGITFFENDEKFIPKKSIVGKIAVDLAGFVAEKIIFGEDNISTGSASDIGKVTQFASEMVKVYGLGSTIGSFDVEDIVSRNYLFDSDYALNEEIKTLIAEGMKLAEKTLEENKTLLLHTADYLTKHPYMSMETFLRLLTEYASFEIDIKKLLGERKENIYSVALREQLNAEKLKVVN